MKKILLFAICLSFGLQIAQAQVKFGLKAGVSSQQIDPESLLIGSSDDVDNLELSVKDANYGMHVGFFLQAKSKFFFIQPEVLFNSNSVDFEVQDFSGLEVLNQIKNERYQFVDVPLMMGVRLGPLRLGGGPVGHFFINSSSELFDLEGYEQKFDAATFGWQAVAGLDIWKLVLDVKYEGNFSNYGEHMSFFGTQYNFDKQPGKLVASLGYAF